MGIIEYFVLCVVVVAIAWLTVWAMGQLTPGHPAVVDKIVWFVAVLVLLVTLFLALGLMGHDPQIPRLG